MEKETTFKTPRKALAEMQVVHFGKILFNMQFVAVAVMAASVISFIIPALYYIILICIAGFTLFMAFLNSTYRALWRGGEMLAKIADVMVRSWKYTVPIVAILSVASIVCLCFDKNQRHTARIAVSGVLCVLSLIVLFAKLVNTGVFA